ncbi:unnamed protein product [Pieris macdunnoughi]|uniref:Mitochondrial ribonuclease P catalytic subunit n=2 Tax=Pieris macdunnoughi TaxID=345717 RepID=A0A821SBZ5_9NEOP|nr:unnamed protein product [Pieris macdunnoughi]
MIFNRQYLGLRHYAAFVQLNSTEQIKYLRSVLNNGENDWTIVKENLLKKRGNYNGKNIDAMMLKVMVRSSEFDAAFKFADYLKANNTELSLGATNGLLILYHNYAKENSLSNKERGFILDSYKKLYDKYRILDSATAENLLHALCSICEWKKCMRVLGDIKESGKPTHSAYSTLIGTLFKMNKKTEALNIINMSVIDRRPLQDYPYEEWIKYIFRKYKDTKTIVKYLDEICAHIKLSGIPITKYTADKMKDAYSELKWETNYTTILKKNGECTTCHERLECMKLTPDEFTLLQNNVREKLIVGSDLFLKSSPQELERFQNFLNQTAPYDIVLDALNICYIANQNIKDRLQVLKFVVNHFSNENKKILLLGRKHMMKWNRGGLEYLMRRCLTFFTDDLSQDDPYFITAAIMSGPHTDIVSRDLLRGHRFVLKQHDLRMIFQRWQWEHQWKVYGNKRGPFIQSPLLFTPCAQKNSNIWHIPYEAEYASTEGKVNDGVPDCSTWLCMKPNSVKK